MVGTKKLTCPAGLLKDWVWQPFNKGPEAEQNNNCKGAGKSSVISAMMQYNQMLKRCLGASVSSELETVRGKDNLTLARRYTYYREPITVGANWAWVRAIQLQIKMDKNKVIWFADQVSLAIKAIGKGIKDVKDFVVDNWKIMYEWL